jgi:hypothetical protein
MPPLDFDVLNNDAERVSKTKPNQAMQRSVLTFFAYLQAFQNAALGPKSFEQMSGISLAEEERAPASCASNHEKFLKTTMDGLLRIAATQESLKPLCNYHPVHGCQLFALCKGPMDPKQLLVLKNFFLPYILCTCRRKDGNLH